MQRGARWGPQEGDSMSIEFDCCFLIGFQHEPPSTSPHRKRALWDWSLVGASLSHGGGGGGEDGDAGLAMDAASPLDMEPLSLAQLRAERCPQISAEDLIELLDLNGTKFARPKIVVVDVRSAVKCVLRPTPSSKLDILFPDVGMLDKY